VRIGAGTGADQSAENALKYSPADTAIILSAEEHAGRVQIVVADSGPGIEPAERARIFDFFYRATSAYKSTPGDSSVVGSGLGLAICKGFIEAMGGRITVQAGAQERGTKFVIDLPIDETALHAPRQLS
jgi:two-component system sensor histidine kinase KdpD